jgi:acetyltransferase
MGPSKFERLFNPKSVAVFGASRSSQSVGAMVFNNLVEGNFQGEIVPINPKHDKLGDRVCYPSIAKVKSNIDLAVIATPATTIPRIITQCGEVGIENAIILSAGFGEAGQDGEALSIQLANAAAKSGVRFIGPNCVGLVRPWLSMDATFLKSKTPRGNLALVSQSGALCSAISDWAAPHDLGFSALVSLGNSIDTGFGDVIRFLATDQKTEAILLYVEGIRHARSFISAVRIATRLKPVIVLKSGRHNQSSKAAHTHTGALIGSDAVFDAALERAGAVRVDTFGQLFSAAEILSASKRTNGNRLGIITNGGGAGVLAADRAGDLGLKLPEPSAGTVKKLNKTLSPHWSKSNPIDILGDAKPDAYSVAVQNAVHDESFDGVLVMLTPQAMTEPTAAAQALIDAIPENSTKPVLACWMGESSVSAARDLISKNGIPDFQVPERAVEAFSYLAKFERNTKLALEVPGEAHKSREPDVELVQKMIRNVLKEKREMLSDIESKAVLQAFGVPINEVVEATSAEEAVSAAEKLGYPVAVKIHSPQISHKSDVGGVKLGILDAEPVTKAFKEVTKNASLAMPHASITGVTVEQMIDSTNARELVIGVSSDPVFGPTILFGAGGSMVEVLRDSAVSLPPLNQVLANRLINRTKVARLLQAFRDKPAVNRDSVVDVLLSVSNLVCEFPEIAELDINPVLARPEDAVAIDARIRVKAVDASLPRHSHMAIRPYPRQLSKAAKLNDGSLLTIRPIRPDDADNERQFVRELSMKTKQFRFMHAISELTPKMLSRFTQIDYDREMALVAITEEDGEQVQRGVARYLINSDETSCEFAVVVSDQAQHKGIGTELMKALIKAAKSHGLKTVEGTVLADNNAMLKLMQKLDFDIVPSIHERGLMDVSLKI